MANNRDEVPVAYRVSWGLLGEWWCVSALGEEPVISEAIHRQHIAPGVGPDLVQDRLYGGFACKEPDRRHVYFDTGAYTYTGPSNAPVTPEERAKKWADLLGADHAPGPGFVGGGPFVANAPVQTSA